MKKKELLNKVWSFMEQTRGVLSPIQYQKLILGFIFYKFACLKLIKWFEEKQNLDYLNNDLNSSTLINEFKEKSIKENGYFINSTLLLDNIVKFKFLNEEETSNYALFLQEELNEIDKTAKEQFKGLFKFIELNENGLFLSDLNTQNDLIKKLVFFVNDLDFDLESERDILGDIYEFIISKYAANGSNSGGEFFTPQCVSELVSKIATFGLNEVNSVYDPTCGSGSLLIQAKKQINKSDLKLYGQDINLINFNSARMNLFLHNVKCENIDIKYGNTLFDDKHKEKFFDVVVSNPPYSIDWLDKKDPKRAELHKEDRFKVVEELPPKKTGDFLFVLHSLYHLKEQGTGVFVVFPGILYRRNAEEKIRRYLIENNFVDAIIQLPSNLFYSTQISTCLMILKKNRKAGEKVLFINASNEFKKESKFNILTNENIDKIYQKYINREVIKDFSGLADIEEIKNNSFNLSVGNYIAKEENKKEINIEELNKEIDERFKKHLIKTLHSKKLTLSLNGGKDSASKYLNYLKDLLEIISVEVEELKNENNKE